MPNLVGIGLSQVPTNSMLGGLAYQDPEHASIKNLDLKNLSQINSEIADTATDVFVYDTSKDSDGGAWRKRTTHTSWYNETLGTATRGTRKEFPAVAVIVAEQDFIKIYDGDDPDLPMWMVFNTNAGGNSQGMANTPMVQVQGNDKVVHMLNGILATGTKNEGSNYGQPVINFISEKVLRMDSQGGEGGEWMGNIAQRNDAIGYRSVDYDYVIAASQVNDIAMTVLPNAPVDSATGLPVPTIAVGTVGGVSVIRDDGTVADITGFNPIDTIHIDRNNIIASTSSSGGNDFIFKTRIPASDEAFTTGIIAGTKNYYMNSNAGTTPLLRDIDCTHTEYDSKNQISYRGGNGGIDIIAPGEAVSSSSSKVNIAYITTSYNTGYQHGDIKGAFLSDTDIEDGVELVSNGTFNTNTTGWTVVGGASATVSSGQVQLTNNGTTNSSLDQTVTTVVGKTYEISATITPQGGGPVPRLYVGNKYVQVPSNANSAQTVTLTFLAYSTSTIVSINANTNVNNAVTLADNVSMKLTNDVIGTNLIANGDFGTGNFTNWSTSGTTTPSISSGGALLTTGAIDGDIWQNTSSEATSGKWVITWTVTSNSGGFFGLFLNNNGANGSGGSLVYDGWTTSGSYYYEGNITAVEFRHRGSSSGIIDNITLRRVEDDRSVNNKGLQVFGTVTKSVVTTGAELVGYSGFTNSNYLKQPYNSNMDFGTGDFSVTWWQYITGDIANSEYVYDRQGSNGHRHAVYYASGNSGTLAFYTNASSSSEALLTGINSYKDGWACYTVSRNSSGLMQIYVNGEIKQTTTLTVRNLTNTAAELFIGIRHSVNSGSASQAKFALMRFSKSIPSPEQVKKIYEDEKCLFHENAKATLYGSSDAVTALAFDEVTDQLHVGTSSGRSDFQGLRRINNTTTAVTTAISAHDEFIIEQ